MIRWAFSVAFFLILKSHNLTVWLRDLPPWAFYYQGLYELKNTQYVFSTTRDLSVKTKAVCWVLCGWGGRGEKCPGRAGPIRGINSLSNVRSCSDLEPFSKLRDYFQDFGIKKWIRPPPVLQTRLQQWSMGLTSIVRCLWLSLSRG